jgi:hypothetical protein
MGPALAQAGFEAACARAPEELIRSSHVVGGRPMHLSVVGRDLHSFLSRPALPIENGARGMEDDSLRVEVWDGSLVGACGVPMSHDPEGANFGGWPEALKVEEPTGTRLWGPAFALSMDTRCRAIRGVITNVPTLRQTWHPARPLHPMLMPWQLDLGLVVIHAGCVQTADGAVLLAGSSGAGKSTSTIACGLAGLPVLGDESIAVEMKAGKRPVAHCLSATAKLTADGARRLPAAGTQAELQSGMWAGESVLFLSETNIPVEASCELAAIVFPRTVASADSQLGEISRTEALRRLTGATLAASRERLAANFDALAGLIESVPLRSLDVGRDSDRIPEAIEAAARLTPSVSV